ncbi:MAG: glycosyltransferase [Bacteroidetes bacterium]|nr:glycosyltransferase [Bacteroidota bacterium]
MTLKIAVVHDWFNDIGGAEKVVREILLCYPDADVFSLIDYYDDAKRENYLLGKRSQTSFIQLIPFSKNLYRFLFPLFPKAIESLDLSAYDVIISSSSSVAKGIQKKKSQLHICYCHSPVRYAWDLRQDYLSVMKNAFSRSLFNYFLNKLQKWDLKSNERVDVFIANSQNVKQRIQNNYNRDAVVIYPPVDVYAFDMTSDKENYYFTVSRLVAYKKTEQIVKAFANFPHLKLIVAGDGPNKRKIQKIAGSNVEILGYLPTEVLREKIKHAKAFIANANEDFGITVVEAQSCGTPIIVPNLGGYKETVNEKVGRFFEKQTVGDIEKAISDFESEHKHYKEEDFMTNVKPFDKKRFHNEFTSFVEKTSKEFFNT